MDNANIANAWSGPIIEDGMPAKWYWGLSRGFEVGVGTLENMRL